MEGEVETEAEAGGTTDAEAASAWSGKGAAAAGTASNILVSEEPCEVEAAAAPKGTAGASGHCASGEATLAATGGVYAGAASVG